MEGVSRGRAVGVERPDALGCDDLVVRGVARRVFDDVELEAKGERVLIKTQEASDKNITMCSANLSQINMYRCLLMHLLL